MFYACSSNNTSDPPDLNIHSKKEEIKPVVTMVDSFSSSPSFPGGENALQAYFEKNVPCIDTVYWHVTGQAELHFDIDTNGRPINLGLFNWTLLSENKKEEIACWEAIKNMPAWIPGTADGKKVKCKVRIPVKLKYFD